ncbi:transcription factor-like protein 28 [Elsinoe australis]|uniref:Transcription factor-like protein 28 n=1 Tax=Elsinoe australis TaxID=40998 RepID=A0A4U7AU17_9PEZI|nr:transcription factor-like protein 28 [Elsinoe australis]
MADGQNYPSPDAAHTNAHGPFYDRPQHVEQSDPQHDISNEIADDLQLRADLARSLAPIAAAQQQVPLDEQLLQYNQQLQQDGLVVHQGSPDEVGPDGSVKRKDQRVKTSKACDECRRKKVHTLGYSVTTEFGTDVRFRSAAMPQAIKAQSHAQIASALAPYVLSADSR